MPNVEASGDETSKKWKSWVGPAVALALFLGLVAILVVVILTNEPEEAPAINSPETGGATSPATSTTPAAKRRPHIILILADDLGFNDISWNNPDVDTPVLEMLARDGILLEQNYMAPMCSPSRGSLMTGKYPFRIKMQHSRLTLAEWCIPHEEKTMAEYLQEAGYKTHVMGKWHQGFCSWNCTPLYRGFDSFYGFYRPLTTHYTHTFRGVGYDWRNGNEIDFSANGTYTTDLITRRAVETINSHDPDEPLFLFVSHAVPHTPVEVPPGVQSHDQTTAEGKRTDYLAMVKALDDSTGEVLEALSDTGLYDNSIIIFSSDNGAETTGGSNYPLRGGKWSVFEGGTRGVAMVHSPLQTTRGIVSHGLVHVTDWFNTILSLAESSAELGFRDGLDQTNHILHGAASPRTEMIYNLDDIAPYTNGKAAMRVGDYKLILGYPGLTDGWEQHGNLGQSHIEAVLTNGTSTGDLTESPTVTSYDWVAVAEYSQLVNDSVLLFNVKDDPTEENNLAESNPEMVQMLRMRLEELQPEIVPQDPQRYTFAPQGLPSNFDGVWSPGWCDFDEM